MICFIDIIIKMMHIIEVIKKLNAYQFIEVI
jgi:hypothetical protein